MYSAAIDALASTGQLQEAEHMLQQLLDNQAHVFAALTASMGSSSKSSISATAGQQLGQSRADGGTQDSAGTASAQDPQAVHSFLSSTAQLDLGPAAAAAMVDGTASKAASESIAEAGYNDLTAASRRPAGQQRQRQRQQQRPPRAGPGTPDQQRQHQQPGVAGATRNKQQVLRQQYNSLIKGWLQLAAAQASEQAEQLWLMREGGSSSGGSSSSNSMPAVAAISMPDGQGVDLQVRQGVAFGAVSRTAAAVNGASHSDVQQPASPAADGRGGTSQAAAPAAAAAALQPQLKRQLPLPSLLAGQQQQRQQILAQQVPLSAPRQQQQQQPVVQRAGVGLVRPVLPQQSLAASADEVGPASSSLDGPIQQQQQQQQQQQRSQRSQGLTAAAASSNADRKPAAFSSSSSSDGYGAALAVLHQMQAAGVAPAADTYTLFIDHCIKVGCSCTPSY
jgi:hypothetical protein